MRIKWIYLVVIIIQVLSLGEFCQVNTEESNLITIATGENYDFYLFDYVVADDIVYQLQTDSPPEVYLPFSFMMQKNRYGIINDEVIDIIPIFNEILNQQYYYCFQRSIQDDQIFYKLVKCKFNVEKEIITSEIEFIIKRDYCYSLIYYNKIYYITCQDMLTNQLEFTIFNPVLKLYQSIIIKDIIVPEQARVQTKIESDHIGVLISKGRIENNKYISEYAQLYLFFAKYDYSTKTLDDIKIIIYKQYEVLNEPDDYITDFALYQEIAFIVRMKRGLTFRNLKIAWSDEMKLSITSIKNSIFGIHIAKDYMNVSNSDYFILLMLWGEDFLQFVQLQLSKNYGIQASGYFKQLVLRVYAIKSEKVFKRKVTSSNQYVVLYNDEEFSVFQTDFTLNKNILEIYQGYVNSRFFVISFLSLTLLYEEQNVVYTLDLQLPKIEIVNLTDIQPPKLLQIKAATFDVNFPQVSCPDVKIHYQVQHLDVKAIWPLQYKKTEQNVYVLRYTKNEQTILVDLSKVVLGQALVVQQINVKEESQFKAQANFVFYRSDFIQIQGQELHSVDYATTCLFTIGLQQPTIFVFVKVERKLIVAQCSFDVQKQQYCNLIEKLNIQGDDIKYLTCKSFGSTLQVSIVQKIKHGFVGEQIYTYYFYVTTQGTIVNQLLDTYQDSKGNILSISLFPQMLIFTRLVEDVYTLNIRLSQIQTNNVNSIELNCFKLFEFACDSVAYYNFIFLPMIQYKNYMYHLVIEIYIVQDQCKLDYGGSINVGITKKPTKERMQVELVFHGIIILLVTDISENEQIKQLIFIDKVVFLRNFLFKRNGSEISIKKLRSKVFPTFELNKIYKIKATERFLYVYGSEIDGHACIYIYRLYSNQMDSLYNIIRTDFQSLETFNVISMEQMDLLLFQLTDFRLILMNPKKTILITRSKQNVQTNNNEDELIELKIRTYGSKDENLQDFYIKLTCTDCKNVNGSP